MSSWKTIALFGAVGLALAGPISCVDERASGRGIPRDAGVLESGEGDGCPEANPRTGERCPSSFASERTCTYQVAECTAPNGNVYPETLSYCCVQDLWQVCGGQSPCDSLRDASASRDSAVDVLRDATALPVDAP